jgi:hypothetical protein
MLAGKGSGIGLAVTELFIVTASKHTLTKISCFFILLLLSNIVNIYELHSL